MDWKENLAEYFNFSRRDRIAVIVLVLLITGVFFLPAVFPGPPSPTPADTAWIAAMKRIERRQKEHQREQNGSGEDNASNFQYDRPAAKRPAKPGGELFYFDPNKLTEAGWKRLGIRDKTARTILNYLSKGGKFRKADDLERIYGLFPDEFERIRPYIKIEESFESSTGKEFNEEGSAKVPREKTFTSRYRIIDINTADTSALIALPGIGSKLATRIISFRDKLGGFYSIDQVAETFGLPDSTFQKIKQWLKLENSLLRKININNATLDELKAHPYIRYTLANPIIAYRNEHGPFAKIEDIKKVMAVTETIYKKVLPYLSIEK